MMLVVVSGFVVVAHLHARQAQARGQDVQPVPGAVSCAAIARAAVPATTITSATYAEAGTTVGPNAPPLPAHCVVRGAIAPRVGEGGHPYETRFELRLPTEWTGRFFYQGGGGNDGTVAPAIGRNTGSFNGPALARGFAVVTTDAGHQGGGPEFALDPTARIDHAYAAHERTATTAKARCGAELAGHVLRRGRLGQDADMGDGPARGSDALQFDGPALEGNGHVGLVADRTRRRESS